MKIKNFYWELNSYFSSLPLFYEELYLGIFSDSSDSLLNNEILELTELEIELENESLI